MTALPTVSVVVVSRDRPAELKLCLTALGQLVDAEYEIIVVTDLAGIDAVGALGIVGEIKLVPFDEANISAARNKGIVAAAGEIVAFIDDDAVPEPTWLSHLVQPFANSDVGAVGGFVRGRNGISFQWKARDVRPDGTSEPIPIDGDEPLALTAPAGRGIKTEGTNMAFRRDVLAERGGFDPAFRFFLDETDLNLRLGKKGITTAIVPRAQVHHGFTASASRRGDRAPRDLTQVGASLAIFLRKHCPEEDWAARWIDFRQEQRERCLQHMVAGRLDPLHVSTLMKSLSQGWSEGFSRRISALPPLPNAPHGFRPFVRPKATGWHRSLSGSPLARRRLARAAESAVAEGDVATVFRLSRTALFHRIRFHPKGYWLQTGGRFGRSDRNQPLFRWISMKKRVQAEEDRVAGLRFLTD